MIKTIAKTIKNIATINRRIKTTAKLFGTHSAEYEDITNRVLGDLEFTMKNGIHQIRNTAANRQSYQFISAQAKKIREMPVQVLQRKAKKQRERYEDYREVTGDRDLTFEAYQWFSKEISDLNEEVYALVETAENMNLLDFDEHNDNLYLAWRSEDFRYNLYRNIIESGGKDKLFKRAGVEEPPVEDYTEVEYGFDPETGEMFTNPNFYDF